MRLRRLRENEAVRFLYLTNHSQKGNFVAERGIQRMAYTKTRRGAMNMKVWDELTLRRAKFREGLDELLKRYDNAMFNLKDEEIVLKLEKEVKVLME